MMIVVSLVQSEVIKGVVISPLYTSDEGWVCVDKTVLLMRLNNRH